MERVNKELEEGMCTNEQRDKFEKYYLGIKSNYDRLIYCKHLLNLPPRFIQKIKENRIIKENEKMFKKLMADKESVVAENSEGINMLNETLKEVEDGRVC